MPLTILASSSEDPMVFISLIVFFALFGGIFYIAHRQAKKRTAELALVAESLGLAFSPEKRAPDALGLPEINLFSKGRSNKVFNVMSGQFADAECRLFDYRYTTGGGKNSSTHTQTVVAFQIPGAELPHFVCKPEHFFHKFADMFGYEDIDFEAYPKFSEQYRLNGDDRERIEQLFSDEVIQLLEAKTVSPWSVDGGGDWLVIHQTSKTWKPAEIGDALLDATSLLNAMTLAER